MKPPLYHDNGLTKVRHKPVLPRRYPDSAKRVKAIRAASGLNQEAFAKSRGINLRTLQGWEAGWFRPSADGEKKLKAVHR